MDKLKLTYEQSKNLFDLLNNDSTTRSLACNAIRKYISKHYSIDWYFEYLWEDCLEETTEDDE